MRSSRFVALLVGGSSATGNCPISWNPSGSHSPMVDVTVTLEDGFRVSGRINLEMGPDAQGWIGLLGPPTDTLSGTLHLLGVDNLEIQDNLSIGGYFNRTDLGYLNLNPQTLYTTSLGSFIISPSEFVVGPSDPQSYCRAGSEFTELSLADISPRTWITRISNTGGQVVIDTSQRLTITAADHARFLEQIAESNREDGLVLSTSRNYPYWWVDMCDIDRMDEIWPILSFSLETIDGGSFDVEFTPRDYIKIEYVNDHTNAPQNRCIIDVGESPPMYPRTYFLGNTLFKKYAVYFEQVDAPQMGICLARSQ